MKKIIIIALVISSCAPQHLTPHYSYRRVKAGCLETKKQGFLPDITTLYEGCDCRDMTKKQK